MGKNSKIKRYITAFTIIGIKKTINNEKAVFLILLNNFLSSGLIIPLIKHTLIKAINNIGHKISIKTRTFFTNPKPFSSTLLEHILSITNITSNKKSITNYIILF